MRIKNGLSGPISRSRRSAVALAAGLLFSVGTFAIGQEGLIGTIEGPTTIVDAAQFPTTFQQAPVLDALVAAGDLPPLEERLPIVEDLLVIEPLEATGIYSSKPIRRAFTGPGDVAIAQRFNRDTVLFFTPDQTQTTPNVAKSVVGSDDGKVWTITLRRGMKWSDGAPFTADDFVFWYEHIAKHPDLGNSQTAVLSVGGVMADLVKVDDITLQYTLPKPNFLFPEALAGYTTISSHWTWGRTPGGGGFAPAHYLKQFHPDFVDADQLAKLVAEAGVESWPQMFTGKNNGALNVELPVVTPWKSATPANEPVWVLERNPYYFGVDTAGNQLPYVDEVVQTLMADVEAINLAAMSGELDFQARHLLVDKLPLFIENQEKAGYKLYLDPAASGANAMIAFNMTYDADPVLAELFATQAFRQALSIGIDRAQVNETFFLGIGTPGSIVPADSNPYNPGPEYRKLWAEYEPDRANAMLDELGLTERDADGYRLRSDGQRLTIEIGAVTGSFIPSTAIAEMVREHWAKIGVDTRVQQMDRTLYGTRNAANENQTVIWDNGNSERLFSSPFNLFPAVADSFMGPLWGAWFASSGAQGVEPPEAMRDVMTAWQNGPSMPEAERIAAGKQMWATMADEVWSIGLVGIAPAVMGVRVAKTDLGNVPSRQMNNTDALTPGISRPDTLFWKQ